MYKDEFGQNKNIFGSQLMQETADFVLPLFLGVDNTENLYLYAEKIAEAFECRKEFKELMNDSDLSYEKSLLDSFIKNSVLLIEKTWVEKSDERLKTETALKLEKICDNFKHGKNSESYKKEFSDFFKALEDLVFLLFGKAVKSTGFLEYAVRIDTNFGFFWHYISEVSKIEIYSGEKARIAILLAVIFLANF